MNNDTVFLSSLFLILLSIVSPSSSSSSQNSVLCSSIPAIPWLIRRRRQTNKYTHTHPRRKQRKQKIRSSFSSSCLAGNCLFCEFVLRPGEDEEIHKIQLQEEDTKWICLVIRRSPPHSLVHSSIPISRLVKFCRPILNPQERRRCTDFPPHTILLVVVQ